MKFAYADPPYLGMGKRLYDFPEWDAEETHRALLHRLRDDYPDGWAFSCNPRDLKWLLPFLPDDVRVCAWTKTYHQWRDVSVQFAWEPVLLHGGRSLRRRVPMVRDWFSCSTVTSQTGFVGSKPPEFCRWVLELLGFDADEDTIDDLFPGSGIMGKVAAQGVLA